MLWSFFNIEQSLFFEILTPGLANNVLQVLRYMGLWYEDNNHKKSNDEIIKYEELAEVIAYNEKQNKIKPRENYLDSIPISKDKLNAKKTKINELPIPEELKRQVIEALTESFEERPERASSLEVLTQTLKPEYASRINELKEEIKRYLNITPAAAAHDGGGNKKSKRKN